MSPLVAAPLPSNNNIRFLLPGGLSCLSEGLTQNLTQSELREMSGTSWTEAKAENGAAEAELDAKDPLDF